MFSERIKIEYLKQHTTLRSKKTKNKNKNKKNKKKKKKNNLAQLTRDVWWYEIQATVDSFVGNILPIQSWFVVVIMNELFLYVFNYWIPAETKDWKIGLEHFVFDT